MDIRYDSKKVCKALRVIRDNVFAKGSRVGLADGYREHHEQVHDLFPFVREACRKLKSTNILRTLRDSCTYIYVCIYADPSFLAALLC